MRIKRNEKEEGKYWERKEKEGKYWEIRKKRKRRRKVLRNNKEKEMNMKNKRQEEKINKEGKKILVKLKKWKIVSNAKNGRKMKVQFKRIKREEGSSLNPLKPMCSLKVKRGIIFFSSLLPFLNRKKLMKYQKIMILFYFGILSWIYLYFGSISVMLQVEISKTKFTEQEINFKRQ